MPGNIHTIPAEDWLREQFEYEYCPECGGDAVHHKAIPFNGNWFAFCLFGPSAETGYEHHPVIQNFRRAKGCE